MTNDTTEKRKLSGVEKAAALLLVADQSSVAKIFSMMSESEIREISFAMASLGPIPSPIIEELVTEFTGTVSGASVSGTLEATERLLNKVLDKNKAQSILETIKGAAGQNTWDKLGSINEDVLADYLRNEYPQTASIIVSKLPPKQAARVLSSLPEEFALEIIMRTLNLEPVKKEVMDKLEKALSAEFIASLGRTHKYDTKEAVAGLFNHFDRAHGAKFMSMLEEKAPEQAAVIKKLMFTFNDLLHISGIGIQALLRNVDKNKLAIALKGASEEIRNLFIGNMSQRAAKILQSDIEALGPVRVKDIDEAQGLIIEAAREMAAKGEITISSGGDEDQLVY